MKKPATKFEKEHMRLVKSMPCVVCNPGWFDRAAQAHLVLIDSPISSEYDHLVDGNRLGHMFGIPLCTNHHLGKKRYKKGWEWDSSKPNQWRLMEKVYRVLGKEIPEYKPKGHNNFKGD